MVQTSSTAQGGQTGRDTKNIYIRSKKVYLIHLFGWEPSTRKIRPSRGIVCIRSQKPTARVIYHPGSSIVSSYAVTLQLQGERPPRTQVSPHGKEKDTDLHCSTFHKSERRNTQPHPLTFQSLSAVTQDFCYAI